MTHAERMFQREQWKQRRRAEERAEAAAKAKSDATHAEHERPRTRGDCEYCHTCQEHIHGRDSDRSEIRDVNDVREIRMGTERASTNSIMGGALRVRGDQNGNARESPKRIDHELRMHQSAARDVRYSRIQCMDVDGPALHQPEVQSIPDTRSTGDLGVPGMVGLRDVLSRHGSQAVEGAQPRQEGQQPRVRAKQLPMGHGQGAEQEQADESPVDGGWSNRDDLGVGGDQRNRQDNDTGTPEARMERLSCGHLASRAVNRCRPCVRVSCRHSLYLDVNPESGTIKINFPDREPWELKDSCSLDVSARGGITLEEVGLTLNVTRERTRQLETRGLLAIKQFGRRLNP